MMKSFFTVLIGTFLSFQAALGQDDQSQESAEKRATQQYEAGRVSKNVKFTPAPSAHEDLFGAHVVRTSTLLATSRKEYRHPVKVLIYGPSIVGSSAFTQELESQMKAKFPYADITVENSAIGGFGPDRLVRTAWHDVYPAYPDLIVFHAYMGFPNSSDVEQIFSHIRRKTTAEIILMNNHVDSRAIPIEQDPGFVYTRYLAAKYDCELVDISTAWFQYLADNNLEKEDLLRDHVHQNREGSWLMANLIVGHLQYNPLYQGDWLQKVRTYYTANAYDPDIDNPFAFSNERWKCEKGVPVGESPQNTLKFKFYGNRIDIIAGLSDSTKLGSAHIRIDGQPVSGIPGLYAITRPSRAPTGWAPAILRIGNTQPLIAETWTLRIDQVNADSTEYHFSVRGSRTGFDGSGNTSETFTSNSGRVVIEPSDFFYKVSKNANMPVGFEITWTVYPLFREVYKAPAISDRSKACKTTIVQGLTNDYHTIEIIPVGDGEVPVEAFEVHRPPMK